MQNQPKIALMEPSLDLKNEYYIIGFRINKLSSSKNVEIG